MSNSEKKTHSLSHCQDALVRRHQLVSQSVENSANLALKSALADILAARKQSAITFEVFILWLRNQHYYTRDVIRIKMTYRDLRYYEGIRAKTCCEYKNKHKKSCKPFTYL